jgi:alpha-L-rhamnosidase
MKTKKFLVFSLLVSLFVAGLSFFTADTPVGAISWTAKWIWQPVDGPDDTWICFRKTFSLASVPSAALANLAVDSRYWMWINGTLAVREGGLKRGPTPNDTYYDEVDIKNYLVTGSNTIAVLVDYWGSAANINYSHKYSGKGGFLFQSDLGGTVIQSDSTWKMKVHPAYEHCSSQPSDRLVERSVRFNAANDIPGWYNNGYNDSSWSAPTEKGTPPCAPWSGLWKRPTPQFKNSATLLSYTNQASLGLPKAGDGSTLVCNLPYNAQNYPYIKLSAGSAGLVVKMFSGTGQEPNLIGEYLTKGGGGDEEFEMPMWLNGDTMKYVVPSGVTIKELKYRETGYDTTFAGSFTSSDSFLNSLWEKSKRTLYVCMRDQYMDCPDRERGQWAGDAVIEMGQAFYALDRNADKQSQKFISNVMEWQAGDKTIDTPVPGCRGRELPPQMLCTVGTDGIWRYYMYSGDSAAISDAYPHVRDYLNVWTLDSDGLVNHRGGDWDWEDWGSNIDRRVLDNCWYYWALKAAKNMANLTGNTGDVAGYDSKIQSIENNFNRVLWNGTEYRSPGYSGDTDDRGNGLAVVAGLADSSKWPAIRTVLQNHRNASPWMEKWVEEALFVMGNEQDSIDRMKSRYDLMVNFSGCTTLWEFWTEYADYWGTKNHAWSGGPLTLLSQYGAGVAPETAAFGTYHILPQAGSITTINSVVPSIKGNINVNITRDSSQYKIDLTSPSSTTAIVGLPKNAFAGAGFGNKVIGSILAGTTTIWSNGSYTGGATGISWNGEDGRFVKFNANPGTYSLKALPGTATCTPTPGPTSDGYTNIPQSQMTATATTEHPGNEAGKAIDGSNTTFWHSEWTPLAPLPQAITLNLGGTYNVARLKYQPRTDGTLNGTITTYNIYISTDGTNFTKVVNSGTWSDDTTQKTITWPSVSARYLRLEAIAGHNTLASAAELIVAYADGGVATSTPTPAATPNGNLALNKTVNARCSLESTDWGRAKMVDGQQTSVSGAKGYTSDPYQTGASNNEWVEIDLGANNSFNQVKLFPRTDISANGGGTANFPVDFTIQVKSDGGSYSTVKTVTGQANPNGTVQTYDIGSRNARYLKIDVTKLGTPASDETTKYRLQLAEVEIRNTGGATTTPMATATPTPTPTATLTPAPTLTPTPTPTTPVNLALNKTVTASSSFENNSYGWAAVKAVDGNRNSVSGSMGWTSWDNTATNHTEWVKVDLGAGNGISRVDLYPRNDSGKLGEGFPVDFTIQVSTDDSNWTTVVTKTSYAKPGNSVQSFSFTAMNARYVKITGTNLRYNSGESAYYMQFAEIEVYN